MEQEYLKGLAKESEEYLSWKPILETYTDLYSGGAQFKAKAQKYLYRRHREPGEIFQERSDRAFYENYIGSIIDWYASTLFRREAIITINEASTQEAKFYFSFLQNCDRNGTNISDFFRKRFNEALVYGRSYICLEFPFRSEVYANRYEELLFGADQPYLVGHCPLNTVNKIYGESGKLAQITFVLEEEKENDKDATRRTRYITYDRDAFYIVEKRVNNSISDYKLIAEGAHSCTNQRCVPVVELEITEGMWLMNKAASLQIEHYNKSNSLAWSLGMALYATPVIYSKKDWTKMIGESYYIHLDPDDKFGWTEPEGKVYTIALGNLNRLQEELYRTCYLLSQSKSWLGGARNESAQSKIRDYQITHEVLRAYGDSVKNCMNRVLALAAEVTSSSISFSVGGLDQFEPGEFRDELEEAKSVISLGFESKTFKQQLFKRLAFKLLSDVNESTKAQIAEEIDQSLENE